MKTLIACVAIGSALLTTSGLAQKSTIEGTASGLDGRPLKNAQVRVQQEKARSVATITNTDAKGHFIASNLTSGSYQVTVLVGGVLKFSVAHVKTMKKQAAHVNVGGKQPVAVAAAGAPHKKKFAPIWVPASTGSHLGGHWEDDPRSSNAIENLDQMSVDQLQRIQTSRASVQPPGTGGR